MCYSNSYEDYYCCVFFLSYCITITATAAATTIIKTHLHLCPILLRDPSQQSPLYMNAYSNGNGSGAGVSTGMQASAPHFDKPATHCRNPCREGRQLRVIYEQTRRVGMPQRDM